MEIKSVKLNQSHTRTQKDYSGFTDLGHNQAYIHCEKENELSLIRLYKIQDTNIVEKLSLTRSDHITDHEALHTTRNCSRNIPQRPAHRFWVCWEQTQNFPPRFNSFNSRLKLPMDTC